MILDGKKLAQSIYEELEQKIKNLSPQPCLGAVLVGNSSASLRYISQKKKFCEKVWISFRLFQFPENITQDELLWEIESLNKNPEISGYIVQLPLPEHIDTNTIIHHISPEKDVDGFHPVNQGKVVLWDSSWFIPCTPAGIMKIFDAYNISLSWKSITILGQSNIVGKPMAQLCINAGATVTSCNSKTKDLGTHTSHADIIILATGKAWLLSPDMVKKDAIIIDVGFSVVDGKILGDAQTQKLIENGNSITPVPGWVGPMTVAMLLSNTFTAYERNTKK